MLRDLLPSQWKHIDKMATTTGSDAEKGPAYISEEKGGSGPSSHDGEVGEVTVSSAEAAFDEVKVLKQGLKQRHIQMIALAGAIGTVSSFVLGLPSSYPYTVGTDTNCLQRVSSLVQEAQLRRVDRWGAL